MHDRAEQDVAVEARRTPRARRRAPARARSLGGRGGLDDRRVDVRAAASRRWPVCASSRGCATVISISRTSSSRASSSARRLQHRVVHLHVPTCSTRAWRAGERRQRVGLGEGEAERLLGQHVLARGERGGGHRRVAAGRRQQHGVDVRGLDDLLEARGRPHACAGPAGDRLGAARREVADGDELEPVGEPDERGDVGRLRDRPGTDDGDAHAAPVSGSETARRRRYHARPVGAKGVPVVLVYDQRS